MTDTYFLVGGAGFIGSFLAAAISDRGDRVVVYDLKTSHPLFDRLDVAEHVETVAGDITDADHLADAMKAVEPRYVIHLAAMLTGLEADPKRAIAVNCTGTANTLAAAMNADVDRVVWTSSTSVFAPADRYPDAPEPTVADDALVAPVGLYGACKYFCEAIAQAYATHHGVDCIGLRPPGIYGPGKSVAEPHNELIERAIAGEPYAVPYGDQRVEVVYVRDVARAILAACHAEEPSRRIYNLGAEFLSYREMVEAVKTTIGGALTVTQDETMSWTHDVDWSAAARDLGYEPAYTFADGLADWMDTVTD